MAEQCSASSPRGVVVAAAPAAARIGAAALADGGNAFDAAVAAALAEVVLLPPKCGLAGDLVALAWQRGDPAPTALLAIGGAPAGLFAIAARGELAATGANSVGVPGAPAGYAALAERGRLGIGRLAAPAIETARRGFAWSRICSLLSEESLGLVEANNPNGGRFYPRGSIIEPGAVTTLPGLADALEIYVADPAGFLTGSVGQAIVERVLAAGGVLRLDDMGFSRSEWVDAGRVSGALGTYFATPAPTHGPSLLQTVASLATLGLSG